MKWILAAMVFAAVALPATAGDRIAEARKKAELSMHVSGRITINVDGSVQAYELDKVDALPQAVVNLAGRVIPSWQLDVTMTDGRPPTVPVTARMNLYFLAQEAPEDPASMRLTLKSHWFSRPDEPEKKPDAEDTMRLAKRSPAISYPSEALSRGITGRVRVYLLLNPDGSVAEIHAGKIDLRVLMGEEDARFYGNILAKEAVRRIRHWRVHVPPAALADGEPIEGAITVDFRMWGEGKSAPADGQWDAILPVAQTPPPWWSAPRVATDDLDAVPEGVFSALGETPAIRLRDAAPPKPEDAGT